MQNRALEVLDVPIINIRSRDELLSLIEKNLKRPSVCFYINAGYFYQRFIDDKFRQSFKTATHVHLNSFYIGWLFKLTRGQHFQKLNAEDFVYDLFALCEQKKKKIFLLGSTVNAQKTALANIKNRYLKLAIHGYHGYGTLANTISQINKFSPDIMLVGLGFGNQEKWVAENKNRLRDVKLIITIGNFIDILGGIKKLPPAFFKENNLEWLWRLVKEPKRLWKRYFLGGLLAALVFCYALITKSAVINRALALILLLISTHLWPILYLLVKLSSPGPFIFRQKRMGKGKKNFNMYKIR